MTTNPDPHLPNTSKRVYSLDALRAIMMLLGMVIHSAVIYSPYVSQVKAIQAEETNPFFHYLVELIHAFRMQVFFIVSGYFGALLYFRKGPYEMIRNRITRLLFPLVVFTLILIPAIFLTRDYAEKSIAGQPDAWTSAWESTMAGEFLPYQLEHMWFLYFLLVLSFMSWGVALLVQRSRIPINGIGKLTGIILRNPFLRLSTLALLYLAGLWLNKEASLHTSVVLTLDKRLLLCYGIFYAVGWATFTTGTLEKLNWKPLAQVFAGLAFFILGNILGSSGGAGGSLLVQQLTHAATTTLLTFGIIAFFLQRFNSYSKIFAYVMDASYFVYLVNPPFVLVMPGLMAGLHLPAAIQFVITFGVSTLISFLLYHTLVRKTFIGKFLNGKLIWPATESTETTGSMRSSA